MWAKIPSWVKPFLRRPCVAAAVAYACLIKVRKSKKEIVVSLIFQKSHDKIFQISALTSKKW